LNKRVWKMNNTILENINSPLSVFVLFYLLFFFSHQALFHKFDSAPWYMIRKQRQGSKQTSKYPSAKPLTLLSNDSCASLKPTSMLLTPPLFPGRYLPSEYHTMCTHQKGIGPSPASSRQSLCMRGIEPSTLSLVGSSPPCRCGGSAVSGRAKTCTYTLGVGSPQTKL
jgi:hypothetical protein